MDDNLTNRSRSLPWDVFLEPQTRRGRSEQSPESSRTRIVGDASHGTCGLDECGQNIGPEFDLLCASQYRQLPSWLQPVRDELVLPELYSWHQLATCPEPENAGVSLSLR